MYKGIARRGFLGALTAASWSRVSGANDRVRIGVIGYGLIGARHVEDFRKLPDAELTAVCDVYQPRVEQGIAACGVRAKGYGDFRRLLEDKNVDAVVVATPDHWHALMTMMACAAGKDVYVEKPMTLFVREGRWMADATLRYKRVVQVGTQQRSGPHFQEAIGLIQSGYLGKVHNIRLSTFRNIMPGFGAPPPSAPPSDFDYDMWLGPAPKHAYAPHRALYHFRWFWDYSGGQMTNLGTHEMDLAHWAMRVNGPSAVTSSGGRFALQDDGETPDTQDALFEYPGFTVLISVREAAAGSRTDAGTWFYGTKASMSMSRSGYQVYPEMKVAAENQIPAWSQPAGHPAKSGAKPEPWTQPRKGSGSSDEQMEMHKKNFLECIRSRKQPNAPVEDAHRVATACHLANISLRTGRKIRWNPATEEIIGDADAASMLVRPYRKPWDGLLRSFQS